MRILKRNRSKPEQESFDFSIYETKEDEEEVKDIFERSQVTLYRARFSQGQHMNDMMAYTQAQVAKYAIRVFAKSTTIKDYSDLFGSVCELWDQFREIHGKYTNDRMNEKIERCEKLVDEIMMDKKKIDECRKALLDLKQAVYLTKQRSNLGIEVERIGKNTKSSAIGSLAE